MWKHARGRLSVGRGRVPRVEEVPEERPRRVLESGGRRGERGSVDVGFEQGGPLTEREEREAEAVTEHAEEGEGGDGVGVGDVKGGRVGVAHLGDGLGGGVDRYPVYDLRVRRGELIMTKATEGRRTSSILGSAPNVTPRWTIVGKCASSRQRPLAAPQRGPTRMMIGRRGVSDAAAARICSPTHLDSPYAPPAASHALRLTGPSEGAGSAVPPLSEVASGEPSDVARRVSVELINKSRGGSGRWLERAKSTRFRSMRKLPSKMLRGSWSSYVDSHALCTMWVTEERSCKPT